MLGFSQSSYPKKILLGNDTVLAITKQQLITINRNLNNYIHLKKLNRNLQMDLSVSDSLNNRLRNIVIRNDSLQRITEQKLYKCHLINTELSEAITKEKRKQKRILNLGVGGTFLGVLIGILIGK